MPIMPPAFLAQSSWQVPKRYSGSGKVGVEDLEHLFCALSRIFCFPK